jgi:hypothetical protein
MSIFSHDYLVPGAAPPAQVDVDVLEAVCVEAGGFRVHERDPSNLHCQVDQVSVGIVVYMLVQLVVLLHSGLLTGVAMVCTLGLVVAAPLTLDPSAWYWPRALTMMLIVAGAALWSARVAIGARPLLTHPAAGR